MPDHLSKRAEKARSLTTFALLRPTAASLVLVAVALVALSACDLFGDLPEPEPGRFEAEASGDLAARFSGQATVPPPRFLWGDVTTSPTRYVSYAIYLKGEGRTGVLIELTYPLPGEGPAPAEPPFGKFVFTPGGSGGAGAGGVVASGGVATAGGSVGLNSGWVQISPAPGGGVKGEVRGYGSIGSLSGVGRTAGGVKAKFFALPGEVVAP